METVHAVGRRKASIARVFIKEGKGNITINSKNLKEYIPVLHLQESLLLPLKILSLQDQYDIKVNVRGGGIKGQTEAIRLAIARGLNTINQEEYRPSLKKEKLLYRNPKKVERKKFGKKKARKSFQFSKR